jgi:cellulose synthase operon protein C
MQDVVGGSAIEAALYRLMDLPGVKVLYPRPANEARAELNGLVSKAPGQAELYSLRAMADEQALDFKAAEADWKNYASYAKDHETAKLELANYYHRRLQPEDEARVLMEVGSAAPRPEEQYTAPGEQRSWKAFERILPLARDQALGDEVIAAAYDAWIARYPKQSVVYAREFQWLLERRNFDRADKLIAQYRGVFPGDAVFPLKAAALLAYKRGSTATALAVYDKGFEPLWPAELVKNYYGLLAATHSQRRWTADARERLAHNPDDLNAMARLFYYAQQQGHLDAAQQTIEAYRQSKDSRGAQWSAQELYTLAQLSEAIHAYPEAARYDFALYHAQGQLSTGASAQVEGAQVEGAQVESPQVEGPQVEALTSMIRILLEAPDQPVELGSGNLSMYRDIATVDQGPGYWNGILSLWLNSTSPESAYSQEEERARPYFHRAKAAALLDLLDNKYPKAKARAALHLQMVQVFAAYGENALVLKAGNDFLSAFTAAPEESSRVSVAVEMAEAYARTQDTKGEFALYDRMLAELDAMTAGMPLTAAAASSQSGTAAESSAAENKPVDGSATEGSGEGDSADASDTEKSTSQGKAGKDRVFEVDAGTPVGFSSAEAQEYQQLLERYLGRLTATGQLPQALAVLRKELDRNPNDPLLYERLAKFLQENNMSAQQEEVYSAALKKFQQTDGLMGWYDKLARLYLREKKREAFADITKQVVGIFHGTELEAYFQQVNQGGPELFLQLNLYAHQRFPHDEVFLRNLLQAYQAKTTSDPVAWEKLLREHWSDSELLRAQFFDYLSSNGKMDAELAQLRTLAPAGQDAKTNPAAARELTEVALWRSHFEEAAPLMGSLAEAYPADVEIGTKASSLYRSLAYYDAAQTQHAVAIEKQLLAADPANVDRLARIGDILADSGEGDSAGHEDLAAAAAYWRRMALVHPGDANGYLQAATVFWDYFEFDDALQQIHAARAKFNQPQLFAYEAGAIDEGKRAMADAIREYTLAASAEEPNEQAALRLLQLARRKTTAKMVDEETSRALAAHSDVAALRLRERVLKVQKREGEIAPLLEAALAQTKTMEEAQAIGVEAQTQLLKAIYEKAIEKQIALAEDPVQKIELSYELVRSLEDHKDVDAAARVVARVYQDNAKLMGVVRATTDFHWRNKQSAKAVTTLVDAAESARKAQPELSRAYVVEAASKANASGSYAQARALMAPLIDPAVAARDGFDAYDAQRLAVVADSYARAGDDAGLKQFYVAELKAIHDAGTGSNAMSADVRNEKTLLLRRGLIPALTRMKDYDGAVEQYIAILSAYPEDASATQEASLYAMQHGKRQMLADFASKTVKASPRDSRFAILQARMLTAFEDLPGAVDAYARAVTIRNDRADVYTAKADLEERMQRLDDACKDYERLYLLSYQNPDWMVKVAQARARQGRREETVKALERAWVAGHPQRTSDAFRVAGQLEAWGMLEESLRFAEMGLKAEGDDLLGGSGPGDQSGDDPQGAVMYARLMTRMRQQEKALALLDEARKAASLSPYSPRVVAQQVKKQGLASVTDDEWRKRRVEERKQTATQRYYAALREMAKTVGAYFTPEEKQKFALLVDARWKLMERAPWPDRSQWIEVAKTAGITDVEARMRRQVLLDRTYDQGKQSDAQMQPYVNLQRSRMEYAELAQTLEAYALLVKPKMREEARLDEAQALRDQGDELAEMRVLARIGYADGRNAGMRERYLQLLLKHNVTGFEAFGAASKDKAVQFAAPNYAVAHSNLKVAQTALSRHAKGLSSNWQSAYDALTRLYFRDASPATEAAFHRVLDDERTIGARLQRGNPQRGQSDPADGSSAETGQLTGGGWFYYGMRLGVYRTLAPEKDWAQHDPEEFLAAGLERNPGSAGNYAGLAMAYADAGKVDSALAEYRHSLELAPDSPAVYDAMAVLLWQANRKDEAAAHWRMALAALNRVQDKGPAPASFWSGFGAISEHLSKRRLSGQLHAEMDAVLRNYIARNGNYRSNELLKAAFESSATSDEGAQWVLSLSGAASDPGTVLSDLDSVDWLPRVTRGALLLRELELARIAASHAGGEGGYLANSVTRLEGELAYFYFEQRQDEKAEALLAALPDAERNNTLLVQAAIDSAIRNKRLNALLSRYRANVDKPETLPNLQTLRGNASRLLGEGDKASALAIWEYVYERNDQAHSLIAADFLGLAEARLANGDATGARELMRRMIAQPGDVYASYEMAAALYEKTGHAAEAVEFLSVLAKSVPWDGSYAVRLAVAQGAGATGQPALRQVAGNNAYSYELRTRAAGALHGVALGTSSGSGELDLLVVGKATAAQAQQPYYVQARVLAAEGTADTRERALLLGQALATAPMGTELPRVQPWESVDDSGQGPERAVNEELRLRLFRAEMAVGHAARALAAIEPLLASGSYYAGRVENPDAATDSTAADGDAETADAAGAQEDGSVDEEFSLMAKLREALHNSGPQASREKLEQMAPMPHQATVPGESDEARDAKTAALAASIAEAYQHTADTERELAYRKLAAFLEKDAKARASLQKRVDAIDQTMALEARNALRAPLVQQTIDQAQAVRPMLRAADLVREETMP